MATTADRRRINGPVWGTSPPVFAPATTAVTPSLPRREPSEIRKIFLKTSLTPPATGSAFLELSAPSTLKLTASVYGPRPLPASASFSPAARVTAELKFAAFSTAGARRGYVRDALERDLSAQLQRAVARAVRTAAYPKSAIDVFVTVLDGEAPGNCALPELADMTALAGAIACASAAIADAGIECVDLVSAGVAGVVEDLSVPGGRRTVLDPAPADAWIVKGAACVAYMAARDELSLVWSRGEMEAPGEDGDVVDRAIDVARRIRAVLNDAATERVRLGLEQAKAAEKGKGKEKDKDVEMAG